MVNLAILSLLAGAVIGMRFKVLILLPLSIFGGLNTLLVALIIGETMSSALISSAVVVLALQAGYLFGSGTRFAIAASRVPRTREAHAPAPARVQES
jgi:hypothetical protein